MKVVLDIKHTIFFALSFLLVDAAFAQLTVNAGPSRTICIGDSVMIGGFASGGTPPYVYSWAPTTGLNNPNTANPIAFPLITTVYTLTVKDATSASTSGNVTLVVGQIPPVDAGPDTTIQEGSVAILHASGGFNYQWSPAGKLKYDRTANAEAKGTDSARVYYLKADDVTGVCSATDSVTVFVIPNSKIVLYNTFTPNTDGNNDVWYIGNISKYPNNHLEIYNRYGKQVFMTNGYNNTWDGKAFGEKLPAATYFYILDLGDCNGVYNGTVTIVY